MKVMDADPYKISIKLSQPNYWQGNVVSGSVEVSSNVFVTVKDLKVKLKGIEKTRLQISPKELVHDKKTIFCERKSIYEGKIKPGNCSFTFQFPLPAVLPGTFSLEEGVANYGIVSYPIQTQRLIYYKVTDVQEDPLRSSSPGQHSPIIKDKRSGSISSKIEFTPKKPEPKIMKPENKQIRAPFKVLEKFGILQAHPVSSPKLNANLPMSGSVAARIWLDRNAYFPGETVLSRLKINSTWMKPLRNISINLVQSMSIESKGQTIGTPSIVHSELQIPDLEPCYLGVRWVPITIPADIPLSSSQGSLTHLSYSIEVNFDNHLRISVPITILIRQYFESMHAIRPPTAILPPPSQIRPPWQPDHKAPRCNLDFRCKVPFNILKLRSHCRHCGKVFCRDCVATKMPIPNLKFNHSVRVCYECARIISDTGGVKYQSPQVVLEGWHKQYSPQWIPNYKKM